MARRSDRPCVYIVEWPDGLMKIGYTAKGRYRDFMRRGGRLVGLTEYPDGVTALEHEDYAHAVAKSIWPQAFTDRTQAVPYLGGTGSGWVECYRKENESAWLTSAPTSSSTSGT